MSPSKMEEIGEATTGYAYALNSFVNAADPTGLSVSSKMSSTFQSVGRAIQSQYQSSIKLQKAIGSFVGRHYQSSKAWMASKAQAAKASTVDRYRSTQASLKGQWKDAKLHFKFMKSGWKHGSGAWGKAKGAYDGYKQVAATNKGLNNWTRGREAMDFAETKIGKFLDKHAGGNTMQAVGQGIGMAKSSAGSAVGGAPPRRPRG